MTKETKWIGSNSFVTQWDYNLADLPETMTYPDGEVVTFTYNNQMLLNSVVGTSTYVQSTVYDSASRMISRALGNGLEQKYIYKPWNTQGGRLDAIVAGSGTWDNNTRLFSDTLQKLSYAYDLVGNITQIQQVTSFDSPPVVQTQTFDYDELDRLWHAGATGTEGEGEYATETYSYNAGTGNLEGKAGVNYTYNSGHAHAVSSLSNGNSYAYDANGNMIERHANGQSFEFDYDAENRLVQVTGINGTTLSASFTYNGDGQRVKSVMDGETTYFVGSHYEKTGTGVVTKYYLAGATRVAMRKDGTLSYLLSDHLGSTSIATDAAGNLTSELRYKPWGETRFSFGTMPTQYQFTGQYAYTDDISTENVTEGFGLVYFNARWVDPTIGRFAQPDTIVPSGTQGTMAWDRYAFVNNNPVRYNDPTGHCAGTALFTCLVVGVAIVATVVYIGTVIARSRDYDMERIPASTSTPIPTSTQPSLSGYYIGPAPTSTPTPTPTPPVNLVKLVDVVETDIDNLFGVDMSGAPGPYDIFPNPWTGLITIISSLKQEVGFDLSDAVEDALTPNPTYPGYTPGPSATSSATLTPSSTLTRTPSNTPTPPPTPSSTPTPTCSPYYCAE